MLILIKGAGDLASGVALRLRRIGFPVMMTDIAWPTTVRRSVSFSQAIFDNEIVVEGVRGIYATDTQTAWAALENGIIPVMTCHASQAISIFNPFVVVDAVMAKTNIDTHITDAPVVIALGPGFTAGYDCHAVIETQRGHDLGRMLLQGSALPNTGVPGAVGGYTVERVIRAPGDGIWQPMVSFGDRVALGQPVGQVNGMITYAQLTGMIRGMLAPGTPVYRGMKAGDIDPRSDDRLWHTVSDKANAIAGGVTEAIFYLCHLAGFSITL